MAIGFCPVQSLDPLLGFISMAKERNYQNKTPWLEIRNCTASFYFGQISRLNIVFIQLLVGEWPGLKVACFRGTSVR